MAETSTGNQPALAAFMPMGAVRLLQVLVLGMIVGLTVWGATLFLDRYIFQVVLCREVEAAQCGLGVQYAEVAASIIGIGAGLYFLVKLQVFRPLLVALAAAISLWGIVHYTQLLPWYGVGAASALLYAFAYVTFAWIARIRLFWVVILILLSFVVAIRLILSA